MTAAYTQTRDSVINGALRVLGVIGAGDTPSPQDYQTCSEALNLYIKQLQTKGMPLWKVEQILVPMVVGQNTYTIGPTGDIQTTRPLRVVMAFIRSPQDRDTTLMVISRQEYMQQGYKPSQGIPNQVYYDPQLGNGVLYIFNTPNATGWTIHLQVQLPVEDTLTPSNILDFPSEWFNCLKFGLADQLAMEYGAPQAIRMELSQRANNLEEIMTDWSQEEASTSFSPDYRFRN